jgi:hypothetical protein
MDNKSPKKLKSKNVNTNQSVPNFIPLIGKSQVLYEIQCWLQDKKAPYSFFTYGNINEKYFHIVLRDKTMDHQIKIIYPAEYPSVKNTFVLDSVSALPWIKLAGERMNGKKLNVSKILDFICESHADYLMPTEVCVTINPKPAITMFANSHEANLPKTIGAVLRDIDTEGTDDAELSDVWELKSVDGNPSEYEDPNVVHTFLSAESDESQTEVVNDETKNAEVSVPDASDESEDESVEEDSSEGSDSEIKNEPEEGSEDESDEEVSEETSEEESEGEVRGELQEESDDESDNKSDNESDNESEEEVQVEPESATEPHIEPEDDSDEVDSDLDDSSESHRS